MRTISLQEKTNIEDLLINSNFKLIKHDITNKIDINADRIWHLACPASEKYQKIPLIL